MYVPELVRKHGMRRGLSPRTIKTYRQCLRQFFRYCKKDPRSVRKSDVNAYLDDLIDKGASGSTINVHLNALKFFYSQILNRRLLYKIRFSKTPKRMPVFLTKKEIKKLLSAIKNPKQNLMIALMYSAGLRVSELARLRKKDIGPGCSMGWVRAGKGNKDRPFIIARKLKDSLKVHMDANCGTGEDYLFKGQRGSHISISSLQKIVKRAALEAGIMKKVHPHTLRHSFSTHLVENGYSVRTVQGLLGHESASTTMVYVHMAASLSLGVESPLDAF